MRKPNFFIVGAPRCGTTALFQYLGSHSRVFTPTRYKEPHFFAADLPGLRYATTVEDYLALFRHATDAHTAVGEGSVWYLFSRVAARELRRFDPAARVIAMLRDPVDLVHSLHAQHVWVMFEPERDFAAAWRLQDARRRGQHVPEGCPEPAILQYAAVGRLAEQVERWLDTFPPEQVCLILFEDFVADTRAVYERVLDFLGLERDGRTSFPRVNAGKRPRSESLARFVRRPPRWVARIVAAAKHATGVDYTGVGRALLALNQRPASRLALHPDLRAELNEVFRDEVRRLARLVGRDLDHWSAGAAVGDRRPARRP